MKTLDELINDFKKLGKALIGQGIEDHETLAKIDRFLERYPTIAQDQGAEISYLPDFSVEKTIGCSYAFDITGDHKAGIYQSITYPERERNVPYQ